MLKECYSKPLNKKQYLTARVTIMKIKSVQTFMFKKSTQNGSLYFCVSVILIDFLYNVDKDYYSHVYLEVCKYIKVLERKKTFEKFE